MYASRIRTWISADQPCSSAICSKLFTSILAHFSDFTRGLECQISKVAVPAVDIYGLITGQMRATIPIPGTAPWQEGVWQVLVVLLVRGQMHRLAARRSARNSDH